MTPASSISEETRAAFEACAECRTGDLCAVGGCAVKNRPPEGVSELPVAWRDAHDYATLYYKHPGAEYEVEALYRAPATPTNSKNMRADFAAWVQDCGCDTDGAWSAWCAATALSAARIRELEEALDWLFANCNIVLHLPDFQYPVEHNPHAKKDGRAWIEAHRRSTLKKD